MGMTVTLMITSITCQLIATIVTIMTTIVIRPVNSNNKDKKLVTSVIRPVNSNNNDNRLMTSVGGSKLVV